MSVEDGSDWDAQARWMKSSFPSLNWPWIISICVNEGYTLYHVAYCSFHDKYVALVRAHHNDFWYTIPYV